MLDRIVTHTNAKEYDEAVRSAEEALKSYPSSFDIVYRSALLYLELDEGAEHPEANSRAIELMDHACELLAQSQDDNLSEVGLRTLTAKAYLRLHTILTRLCGS